MQFSTPGLVANCVQLTPLKDQTASLRSTQPTTSDPNGARTHGEHTHSAQKAPDASWPQVGTSETATRNAARSILLQGEDGGRHVGGTLSGRSANRSSLARRGCPVDGCPGRVDCTQPQGLCLDSRARTPSFCAALFLLSQQLQRAHLSRIPAPPPTAALDRQPAAPR